LGGRGVYVVGITTKTNVTHQDQLNKKHPPQKFVINGV